MKIHNMLVGVSLCAAVSGAGALTLGAARGTVVLGAPVSLAFEVRPDPGQALDASCIAVKLLAGGAEFATGKVQVVAVAGSSSPVLRVRADMPVMEPVLTVNITAGCQGSVTRSYTFLSELPAEVPRSAQPLDIQQFAGNVNVRQAVGRVADVDAANAAARRVAARKKTEPVQVDRATQVRRALRPVSAAATAESQKSSESLRAAPLLGAAAAEATSGSRLVMEAFDLSLDATTALRLSRDLPMFADTVDPQKREQAAALWRVLNLSSDVQQLQAWVVEQEADAQKQKAAAATERAAATELRERLQQVEAERFAPRVVYALGGLVLLALAAIAWLLRRKSRQTAAPADAWQQSLQQVEQRAEEATERKPVFPSNKKAAKNKTVQEPQWEQTTALTKKEELGLPAAPLADAADSMTHTQPLSMPATMPLPVTSLEVVAPELPLLELPMDGAEKVHQIVHPEQLFDTLQQAEFFISVGEHEQAIGVLRKHIEEHGEASPIAYLELLRLYHTLGRSDSFEQLRQEFHARFNAKLPGFAQFHNMGGGLENHLEVLARIEELWTSPEVLAVLDECLFQRGEHQALGVTAGPFEPAALEDLLLLLAIVQTTPANQRGSQGPRVRTTPLALAAPVVAAAPTQEPGFDSLAQELSLMPSSLMPLPTVEEVSMESVAQDLGVSLDLNLEDLPSLSHDVAAVAPTPVPPAPAAALDFNLASGPLDFDFETLEKRQPGADDASKS